MQRDFKNITFVKKEALTYLHCNSFLQVIKQCLAVMGANVSSQSTAVIFYGTVNKEGPTKGLRSKR